MCYVKYYFDVVVLLLRLGVVVCYQFIIFVVVGYVVGDVYGCDGGCVDVVCCLCGDFGCVLQ